MRCLLDLQPAAEGNGVCQAINSNPDLAGIGVRIAFYVQSAMNTLLMFLSPSDSVPSAWAGTILTAALVIAAVVQKLKQTLSLHHATLILNFATLSCISSLAAAPVLPIWRLTPQQYYSREFARDVLGESHDMVENGVYTNARKKRIKAAQSRARLILTLALLIQVVLQWAWGIIMFVSPTYSQPECSGDTVLVIFLHPFRVRDINQGWSFVVWPFWLLFSLGITLVLTIVLALSSPSRAHDFMSRRSTISTGSRDSSETPVVRQLLHLAINAIPRHDSHQLAILSGHLASLGLWVIFLASSEWQRAENCVGQDEDDFGGFGQITAIFLALAPLWSLSVALYKYPSMRRRQERHRQRMVEQRRDRSEERRGLLSPSPFSHSPQPSGTSETFELGNLSSTHLKETPANKSPSSPSTLGLQAVTVLPSDRTGFLVWLDSGQASSSRQTLETA
ncbi:hypothetical protein K474DRAFT_1711093 [Panus rudis PR-1116 ss-1]|nr:hypothetical protein K474DRAFT_1711093 [Panus rudis PR-1116 ss-1]